MADAAPEKKEKKKKEKTSEDEKKPKKSSLKKDKVAEEAKPPVVEEAKPPVVEEAKPPQPDTETNPPAEPQEPKRVEIEEPPKPDTDETPKQDKEESTKLEANQSSEESTTQVTTSQEEEEPRPKPRRKPSKRSLELEIDDEKLNQLKEAFQIFDFDRDGVIDKEDLRKSLIAMGQEIEDIHDEDLEKMMSEACQPLDFDAFIMLLGYRTIELDSEEVLREALSRWDNDGSGLISEEKFRFDLMHLGDKFSEKEVNMALEDAPVSKGLGFYKDIRMIDYGKFCHILCGLRKKTQGPSLEEYGLDVSA